MSVGIFDPGQLDTKTASESISDSSLELALGIARRHGEGCQVLTLSNDEIARLAPLLTHTGWFVVGQALTADDITGLIRLFTIGEGQFPSWQAGAKSPVVALVRVLKKDRKMTPELTAWIKRHTDNRYLPHGDLMDRL